MTTEQKEGWGLASAIELLGALALGILSASVGSELGLGGSALLLIDGLSGGHTAESILGI